MAGRKKNGDKRQSCVTKVFIINWLVTCLACITPQVIPEVHQLSSKASKVSRCFLVDKVGDYCMIRWREAMWPTQDPFFLHVPAGHWASFYKCNCTFCIWVFVLAFVTGLVGVWSVSGGFQILQCNKLEFHSGEVVGLHHRGIQEGTVTAFFILFLQTWGSSTLPGLFHFQTCSLKPQPMLTQVTSLETYFRCTAVMQRYSTSPVNRM